jgi:AraC-like DNA-binding protein
MAGPPEALTGTPDVSAVVREITSALRLSGAVFLEAEFTAPWCILSRIGPEDCAPFVPVPRHIIAYHCIAEGACVVTPPSGEPVPVGAGEIVILPRNDPHLLGSAPGLPPVAADGLIQPGPAGGLARIAHGGGGAPTRLFCGYLGCDVAHPPAVALLPRVMRLSAADAAGHGAGWIETSFRFAAGQLADGGGVPGTLARLAELLFVEAIRRQLDGAAGAAGAAGWAAGLANPAVRRALACMHDDLARRWTTDELAARCNLSRSAFAERFTRVVGEPPLRYLATLRLERARAMLEDTPDSLARIAYAVGYESEAAFSRAFRRAHGLPPATWRRERGAQGQPG